jgi:serine phosphatase RsbU (regulator of sigma subunit)
LEKKIAVTMLVSSGPRIPGSTASPANYRRRYQKYELYHGRLARGEHLVLLSDGIPEARNSGGELYGFERLSSLVLLSAREIAQAAQSFGQEDDITVLTVGFERG